MNTKDTRILSFILIIALFLFSIASCAMDEGSNKEIAQEIEQPIKVEDEAISRATLSSGLITRSCSDFTLKWNDRRSGGRYNGSFYRVNPTNGYYSLGYYGQGNYSSPNGSVLTVAQTTSGLLRYPVDYELIWKDSGSGARMDGAFWRPIPPVGYVALGVVVTNGYSKPSRTEVVCVRKDLTTLGKIGDWIWNDKSTGARSDMSSWEIIAADWRGLTVGTFYTHASHSKPTANVFVLKD